MTDLQELLTIVDEYLIARVHSYTHSHVGPQPLYMEHQALAQTASDKYNILVDLMEDVYHKDYSKINCPCLQRARIDAIRRGGQRPEGNE